MDYLNHTGKEDVWKLNRERWGDIYFVGSKVTTKSMEHGTVLSELSSFDE